MGVLRKLLIVAAALVLAAAGWLWWNRVVKVDMAAYVPGDSLVYVEANDLPRVLNGLTSTAAWRELAPAGRVRTDYERAVKLGGFAAATGIGPGDWVVLARAQLAVAVLGFDAAAEPDATLKFKPRVALVAETHTSEWRVRGVAEKLVGDFARRSFNARDVKRGETDGAHFLTWSDPNGSRRSLVAAVSGSVLVIGNDEAAVRSCLAVRRGERPSLAGNEQLKLMRERLGAGESLAFGFAPAGSPAKIVEVFAPAFVPGFSPDQRMQSSMATFLPQLANRVVGDLGWSSHAAGGAVEDRYFISLPEGMGVRLSGPFTPHPNRDFGAGAYLPLETYQVSRYSFLDPAVTWRGLNAALSSRLSVFQATSITFLLEALIEPYGVNDPPEFFKAAGSEVVTASLDRTSENKVFIVSVRQRASLLAQVRDVLGASPRSEKLGGEELLISNDDDGRAAFVSGDYLLMGAEEDVRRCLSARAAGRTLKDARSFPPSSSNLFPETPFVTSVAADEEHARAVVDHVAGKRGTHPSGAPGPEPSPFTYSLSQTRLTPEGFEKKTRSSFGLIGELIERLSHTGEGTPTGSGQARYVEGKQTP
ncbi:MAG TPA: hypothetical protein VE360_18450 [Pyrinomonadaceae bacterium]|nr:hypothetical protein [Pyrinomonadaceae bacterium]